MNLFSIKQTLIQFCFSLLILFASGCAENQEPPSITETLTATPLSIERMGDMSYVADLPKDVTKSELLLNIPMIDSATDWVYFRLPFESHVNLERQFELLVVLRAVNTHASNPVVFDGERWSYYCVMQDYFDNNWFNIENWAWSPDYGLYFGTDALRAELALGAQGICRLDHNGRIERVFWPPFIKHWEGMVQDRTLPFETPYVQAWNITFLQFSQPNILWAGMWNAVVRLDFGSNSWRLYDDSNSCIQGVVEYIAPIDKDGSVRCVTSPDPLPPDSSYYNPDRCRIFKIKGSTVTEEKLPTKIQSVLNRNYQSITSDRYGNLYISDSSTLWKVGQDQYEKVAYFPDPKCDDYLFDSTGRIWVTAKTQIWVQEGTGWRELSDHLPLKGDVSILLISAFFEDPEGRIWICWTPFDSDEPAPFATVLGKTARANLGKTLTRVGRELGGAGIK